VFCFSAGRRFGAGLTSGFSLPASVPQFLFYSGLKLTVGAF
jgi:hypothetical protein